MSPADTDALARLQPLLRRLREIKGVREVRPGVFHLRSTPFASLHRDGDALVAELRKPGGSGFDRYPVDDAPGQRKLVDDAQRRAARLDDE